MIGKNHEKDRIGPFETLEGKTESVWVKNGNAAHSGVSKVLFFTKPHKWTKHRRKKWINQGFLRETVIGPFWPIKIQGDNTCQIWSLWALNFVDSKWCDISSVIISEKFPY